MNEMFWGTDGRGDAYFTGEEWVAFQRRLIPVEVVMQSIAKHTKATVHVNVRNEWPARRLQLRRRWRLGELRVILNPNFLVDRIERYDLRITVLFEPIPDFIRRLAKAHVIESFTPEQLDDLVTLSSTVTAEWNKLCESI